MPQSAAVQTFPTDGSRWCIYKTFCSLAEDVKEDIWSKKQESLFIFVYNLWATADMWKWITLLQKKSFSLITDILVAINQIGKYIDSFNLKQNWLQKPGRPGNPSGKMFSLPGLNLLLIQWGVIERHMGFIQASSCLYAVMLGAIFIYFRRKP